MTERVKQLFFDAAEMSADERTTFLDRECAGDTALRRRVEALFVAHDQPDRVLDRPAAEQLGVMPLDVTQGDTQPSASEVSLSFLGPPQMPDSLGRLGHYEISSVIGSGGMGIVLRGFDTKLQRVVAIKVLSPLMASSGPARQRFVREARATAAVTHDNVIAIHAVEEEGLVPYFVMQIIDGKTLQQKLDRTGLLDVAEVLRIGLQIADGLAAAHRQGLIHRDIKPANILLENGVERVKITDFGLARAVDDASVTQSGVIIGTPAYMSPEQADGQRVDHRSDLFSLGSVLYAMCSGHAPFRADSTIGVLKRVTSDTPRPLREINPQVPEWLSEFISRLMSKSPADRFQDAATVAEWLGVRLSQWQRGDVTPDITLPSAANRQASVQGQHESQHTTQPASRAALAPGQHGSPTEQLGSPTRPGADAARLARSRFVNRRGVAAVAIVALIGATIWLSRPRERVETNVPDGSFAVTENVRGLTPPGSPEGTEVSDKTSAPASTRIEPWPSPLPNGETIASRLRAKPLNATVASDQTNVIKLDVAENIRRLKSGKQTEPSLVGILGEPLPREWQRRQFGNVLAYSRDGSCLAVGTGEKSMQPNHVPGQVLVFDALTGELLRTFQPHSASLFGLSWSSDGRYLASSGFEGRVAVTDVLSGEIVRQFECDREADSAVAFDAAGERLAIASIKTVQLVDWKSSQVLSRLTGEGTTLGRVAFHSNGTIIANGLLSENHCWSPEADGTVLRVFDKHGGAFIRDLALGQSSGWSCGDDGLCQKWDLQTGASQLSLPHQWVASGVALSPDESLVVTTEWHGGVRLWNAHTGELLGIPTVFRGGSFHPRFDPTGRYLAAFGADRLVRVIDVKTSLPVWPSTPHQAPVQRVALSNETQTIATAALDGSVCLWDQQTRQRKQRLQHTGGVPVFMTFRNQGQRLLVVTAESFVSEYDLTTTQASRAASAPGQSSASNNDNNVRGLTPSGSPKVVGAPKVVGSPDAISAAGVPVRVVPPSDLKLRTLAAAVDDTGEHIAFARLGSRVDLLNTKTKQLISLPGVPADIRQLQFTADSEHLWAIASGGEVIRWNLTASPEKTSPHKITIPSPATAIGRAGSRIAIADEQTTIRLFDSASDTATTEFRADHRIDKLQFHADATRLAAISLTANHIAIWDFTTTPPSRLRSGHLVPHSLAAPLQDATFDEATQTTLTAHDQAIAILNSRP